MNYNLYLQTKHWKQTRAERLEGESGHCYICLTTKNIQVHHTKYDLFQEKRKNLLPLCNSCHKLLHKYYGHGRINKHYIIKSKRLIKYGVKKKWAFILSQYKNNEVFVSLWPKIRRKCYDEIDKLIN
jgi:uncharacterized protein with ATP-grasp and redox domains